MEMREHLEIRGIEIRGIGADLFEEFVQLEGRAECGYDNVAAEPRHALLSSVVECIVLLS
jgi:hypothetical protein